MDNLEPLRQLHRVVSDAPDDLLHMRAVVEKAECGTARCALGWCIIDPWFRENTKLSELFPITYHRRNMEVDEKTLSKIFNITPRNAEILFALLIPGYVNEHAVSKKAVLTNIDRLLNGKRARDYSAILSNS